MTAQLANTYDEHVKAMADAAGKLAESSCTLGQPVWMLPNQFDGDVTKAFSRKELTDMWHTATNNDTPGTYSDIIAITAQIDCLGVAERAFRSRHNSKLRSTAHSAARRFSHSREGGVFTGLQKNYIKNVIAAGR